MSFCTQQVLVLASGIHDSINSPSSISVGYISGVLTSSGFLGALNMRLNTSFHLTGDGPCINGGFGAEESAIASLQFEHDWYKRKALEVMQGMGLGWAGSVVSMREGDSHVARESPTKAAAEWRALRKETEEELYVATAQWLKGHTLATSVDAAPLSAWPTP